MRWSKPLLICFGISIVLHGLLFLALELKGPSFGVRQTKTHETEGPVTLTLVTEVVTPDAPALPVATVTPQVVAPPPKVEPVIAPVLPVLPAPSPKPPASEVVSMQAPAIAVKPEMNAPVKTASPPPAVEAKPDYLRNPPPVYPEAARRKHQEGLVVLAVTVTPQGHASEVKIKKSSGYPILDHAALEAVRNWEFQPARLGPLALESQIEIPVHFELTGR